MRVLLVAVISFLMIGCTAIDTFSAWVGDNDSVLLVRVATAEAIYQGDETGVCHRAFRAAEIVSDARKVVDNSVLTLSDLDTQLSKIINKSGLNPVTASVLLDVAKNVISEHANLVSDGMMSEDAQITLNRLLDAVDSVAIIASADC